MDRPLGQRAVADLAARRAAERTDFTGRVRREVVVEHERLLRLARDLDRVDALLVLGSAEGHGDERLGLATGEDGGAVHARDDADFRRDRADRLEVATVNALALVEDLRAHRVILDVLELVGDFLGALRELLGEGGLGLLAHGGDARRTAGLVLGVHRLGHRLLGGALHGLDQLRVLLGGDPRHLGLADLLDEVVDQLDLLHDAELRDLEAVEDFRLADFERATLDHHDRVLQAGDHEVHRRELELLEGRVQDPVVLDLADARRGDRAVPGDLRDRERGRGGQHADHVRLILLVGREHRHEHLHFVAEAFREERPDRAVDDPAVEDLVVRRATFALEEPTRDLARGVGLLLVLDGQREEREVGDVR